MSKPTTPINHFCRATRMIDEAGNVVLETKSAKEMAIRRWCVPQTIAYRLKTGKFYDGYRYEYADERRKELRGRIEDVEEGR
jgi:hypothetical protein